MRRTLSRSAGTKGAQGRSMISISVVSILFPKNVGNVYGELN
jgi:hypothetical protein